MPPAPNDKAGKVVFIGNIPYGEEYLAERGQGGTEELIIDTLTRVGQVVNFRLVYDKDTGRPKGFGFAEFADADAAASAVRNLNDYDVMGRKLRVDWSNDNGAGDAAPAGYTPAPLPTNGQELVQPPQASSLPPLPPGTDLQPGLSAPDAISRTLSTLPPAQLLDILSQMKGLVMSDPAKATELLRQAPQLSYAIFQSLLLLNLVDTSVLTTIIDPNQAAAPTPAPPPQPPVQQLPHGFPGYPPAPVPTPPVYQPPMPAVAPPQGAAPSKEDLIRQVMSLSQQQIDVMEPATRQQIMMLRQTLMSGQRPPGF